MKVIAVIPAYNEEKNIRASIIDAGNFVDEVVVVDDYSSDKTRSIAFDAGAYVLHHIINRGQGASLQTGTDYADKILKADVIVHFDADGQMCGEDIPGMIEHIKTGKADIVLGSRFLGEVRDIPTIRLIALKGSILMTTILSGINLSDTHNGFRALSRKAFTEMRIGIDRMAHASEILDLIKVKKIKFIEHPVTIKYSKERVQSRDSSAIRAINVLKDFLKGKFFDGL